MPAGDYPSDQSYFPGAKLRLILRLEEYAGSIVDPSTLQPPQLLKGTVAQSAKLVYQVDPTAPPGITRYVVTAAGSPAAPGSPQAQSSSSDGLTQVVAGIVPHNAKLGRNGWKQGDTLDVSFRYVDLPVDPRVFRSVAVEFYLGALTQDQFSQGVAGQSQTAPQGQSQEAAPANLIPDAWVDAAGNQRTNKRFSGWVDDWDYDWTSESTALVTMKCVDNTRLLLDQEMPPMLAIDVTKPVDQAVAQLLTNFPQFQGLAVEYRPAVDPGSIPILKAALGPQSYRPDLGGPTASKGGGTSGTNKQSVWDYLVEIMLLIGHNCRVEDTTIIIQRVRTATSKGFPPRWDDPFAGYVWADGQTHPLRTFVWGRNLKSVKCGRKYTRTARKAVELRCYDCNKKQTLVARHPPLKAGASDGAGTPNKRPVSTLPGDGGNVTKYVVYTVTGITDLNTLQVAAQHYYEGLNRGELVVKLGTRNMASYGGDNSDPDLLDLLAGDRIEYLVDRVDLSQPTVVQSSIGVLEDASTKQESTRGQLAALGFDAQFVDKYLEAFSSTSFQSQFVTKSVALGWDVDKGVDVDVEAVNFVEVALDANSGFDDSTLQPAAGTKPTSTKQASGL
ncbi:MAG TPA: hypothetical protein VN864_01105 [Thermoplasmata archaeon]|nr:hypothetical protein [Thermoplasmata archaeon]